MVPQITATATQIHYRRLAAGYWDALLVGLGVLIGLAWLYVFIHAVRP